MQKSLYRVYLLKQIRRGYIPEYRGKHEDVQKQLQGVIVEMRNHESLKLVLENFVEKLPLVPITLIHGTKNKDFVVKVASSIPNLNIKFVQLNADNLDAKTYSKLLTSANFWEKCGDREKTIIFQTDSAIVGDGSRVAEFVNYDYCGAPWKHNGKVGNGGFSIRNTKLSKQQSIKYGPQIANEDQVFVKWCEDDPKCNICPNDIGLTFSEETVPGNNPWAFHNNITYGLSALNELNKKVHELNVQAKPLGPVPDPSTWQPALAFH